MVMQRSSLNQARLLGDAPVDIGLARRGLAGERGGAEAVAEMEGQLVAGRDVIPVHGDRRAAQALLAALLLAVGGDAAAPGLALIADALMERRRKRDLDRLRRRQHARG